jgi:hypothetical protein
MKKIVKTNLKKRSNLLKSRKKIYLFLGLFVAITLFNIAFIFFNFPKLPSTGFGSESTGLVSLSIEADPIINITSPENITYYFSFGDPYTLWLNVTNDIEIKSWNYSLYDQRHSKWAYENVAFPPNTTFNAVRWGNVIYVSAESYAGRWGRANVTFFVDVPNTSPMMYGVNSSIYVCEGQRLNYPFYAVDQDEDFLTASMAPQIYRLDIPSQPLFFVFRLGNYNITTTNFSISSSELLKNSAVGLNTSYKSDSTAVSVSDGYNSTCCSDSKNVQITVIEINNPPKIEDIGVQTIEIWNKGENSTFYEEVEVNDTEYSLGYGNLTFNLSILNSSEQQANLFDITFNGSVGIINFTANNQTPLGVYNARLCVNDTGLTQPHSKIQEYCNQTGSAFRVCDNFSLTITDINRAPTIISHYPINLSLNVSGTENLYFNITSYDPDATIPDAYWYVDNNLVKYDSQNITSHFNYVFGCSIGGLHKVSVNITDGLLWDSLTWNVSVKSVACPSGTPGGGGGGGGGGGRGGCAPKWGCSPWGLCQNAEYSLDQGILSGDDYRSIKSQCDKDKLDGKSCGFQIRECADLNRCVLSSGKPGEINYCLYSENPSCRDGIKNCHDGDCELLVDCGGPCKLCPSCSDKIKNQGEEGVDCGGPCPWRCIPSIPLLKRNYVLYGFLILLLLLIIFIIIKLIRVLRYKKELNQSRNQKV